MRRLEINSPFGVNQEVLASINQALASCNTIELEELELEVYQFRLYGIDPLKQIAETMAAKNKQLKSFRLVVPHNDKLDDAFESVKSNLAPNIEDPVIVVQIHFSECFTYKLVNGAYQLIGGPEPATPRFF